MTHPDDQPAAANPSTERVARGSSVDFCSRWPDEGHSWSWTSHAGEPLVTTRSCGSCGYLDTSEVREQLAGLLAEVERLRAHILDIDAHATPYGDLPDEPGYVGTYLLSAGALHRALGKIGHSAPSCAAEAERDALAARLERAEKVVGLVGINPVGVGERAAALCQAYIDYAKQYGDMHHLVSDEEVAELARRRQETREATLARIRATPSTSEPTP